MARKARNVAQRGDLRRNVREFTSRTAPRSMKVVAECERLWEFYFLPLLMRGGMSVRTQLPSNWRLLSYLNAVNHPKITPTTMRQKNQRLYKMARTKTDMNMKKLSSEKNIRKGRAKTTQIIGSPGPPYKPFSAGGAQIKEAKCKYKRTPSILQVR